MYSTVKDFEVHIHFSEKEIGTQRESGRYNGTWQQNFDYQKAHRYLS